MLQLYAGFILSVFLFATTIEAAFPDDPKPCKYGDSECIIRTGNYYLKEKSAGDPSLNLSPFDPIAYPEIAIKQHKDSPVNLDVTFANNKFHGLSDSEITKVSGFGKDLTQEHKVELKAKTFTQLSDYKIDGKVLVLPIKGEGHCNITLIEPVLDVRFVGVPEVKDGATYMKIDKMTIVMEPKRIIYNFENLFNGDKALGDTMNQFLNENWKEIYNELRKSIAASYGHIVKNIISKVFSKYPYEKFFTE